MDRAPALFAVVVLLVLSAGCGDGSTPASESCLSSVTHPPPESGPLSAADRIEVVSVTPEGCAPLQGRIAAFNWFSFENAERYLAYAAGVSEILASRGTPILSGGEHAETLEAPAGAPAGGGAYIHEEFALPHYPSATGFMDMLTSPEFQEILPLQQAGARASDYVFGFQQCLVGCDKAVPDVASDEAPLLLHVFRWEGGDMPVAIRALAASEVGPEMIYAGRLVGRFQVWIGGVNVNSQNLPWGEGTMVFRVESSEAARSWLANPVFQQFRRDTAEDVLVVLGSGRLTPDP